MFGQIFAQKLFKKNVYIIAATNSSKCGLNIKHVFAEFVTLSFWGCFILEDLTNARTHTHQLIKRLNLPCRAYYKDKLILSEQGFVCCANSVLWPVKK